MKRRIGLFLVLCLLTGLITACGASPEKQISYGNWEYSEGNYEKAYEHYRKAGEMGVEPLKEALLNQAMEKNKEYAHFNNALNYLLKYGADVFTEDEANAALAERLAEGIAAIEEEFHAIQSNDRYDYTPVENELWHALNSGENDLKQGVPEVDEVLNKGYNLMAEIIIRREAPDYDGYFWADVIEYWEKCTSGTGLDAMQAINQIRTGEARDGIQKFTELVEKPELTASLWRYLSEDTTFTTLNEKLTSDSISRMIVPAENPLTLTESLDTLESGECGTSEMKDSINLDEAMIAELREFCGKAPEGKLLILHSRYGGSYLDLATGFMEALPDSYYPTSLESVSYVIVLDSVSEQTGLTYNGGTKQVREDTTVRLYDVLTGEELYTATENGPTSMVMSYTGTQPMYYSAGAPYISPLVEEAYEIIENQ